MFSHNTVLDYLTFLFGRIIKTDHVFTNFWKYLWSIFDVHDIQDGQKCVGDRNTHDFSLDYTHQFFDNYPNNNKFAYVHLNAAHENTGNVKTIDDDLLRFLVKYLRMIKNKGENLALLLLSDHGHKRLDGAEWDFRTFFEFNTPVTYFIMSKEVVEKLKADENLRHNEGQLVSRYDINLSLKHIAYFPYNISFNSWYPKAKEYYTYKKTLSVFSEKVSVNRTCSQIGVNRASCLCSEYTPVKSSETQDIIKKEMIKLVSTYLTEAHIVKDSCKYKESIKSIQVFSFPLKEYKDGANTLYKIEIKTHGGLSIVVDFNFCLKVSIDKTKSILTEKNRPISYF